MSNRLSMAEELSLPAWWFLLIPLLIVSFAKDFYKLSRFWSRYELYTPDWETGRRECLAEFRKRMSKH